MFAIAFDLDVNATLAAHPRGVSQAYTDIATSLGRFDFRRIQGSVYVTDKEDLVNLFSAVNSLKNLSWFPASVRDIRAFKIELWSDFTNFVKG